MSEERLPALYADLERLGAEAAEWAKVEASDSTEMVHVGSADPEKMREHMIEVRRQASERAKALAAAAAETREAIRVEVDRQRREMEARMRAAMEALAPLQEQVKRMEEGIWTVNLYLGTSEEIVTLREGAPALIDTPIHLRTSVLAMDEEVASFPQEHGKTDWQGMDYRDVEEFDRWLVEEPQHLAQVLPEERGIVVFTPRRSAKVYHEDPLINSAMNEDNFESYWLIRNGENLYRLRTTFPVGRNLMPLTSEFTALFQELRYNRETGQHERVEILPGTPGWEKAEKAQDEKRRHFMRVALIVQGLIDRTEMFTPLHAAVNVMQQRTYDDGLVVVINDTERALTTSREPYFDWIKRLNADLRPGMRIIGTFRGSEWDETECGSRYDQGNERLSPTTAERPPADTLLLIEGQREFRNQKGLVVRYQRTEQIWDDRNFEYKTPKRRASAVILPTDTSIIPFDLVTVEEMQAYLGARTERHAYATMFPLLQAAIAAKQAETEAEAPFRALLTRVLADDTGQTLDEVAPHLDGLVHRFKVGNRWHRPLVSMAQDEEAKALRLIRAEYKRIVNSGASAERDARAVAVLREHDPEIMYIGRLSSGKYVAFAPMQRSYREGAVNTRMWVREHVTTKTAKSIQTREWIAPGSRAGKMSALFEADRWADWDRTSVPDLTDAEMDAELDRVRSAALRRLGDDGVLLAIEHDYAKRCWTVYGVDHALDGQPRKQEYGGAGYLLIRSHWERVGGAITHHDETHAHPRSFDMSYGGNRLLGSGIAAHEREVYMPWTSRSNRGFAKAGESEIRTPPTVVYEADAETLGALVKHVRDERAARDEEWERSAQARRMLVRVEERQRQRLIEEAKAKFLAEYPDEEMWQERYDDLTKGIKAPVRVADDHHFKIRERESEGVYRLHERTGFQDLGMALRSALSEGINPIGLTIRDLYRAIDSPWPSVYEPIADLVIPADGDEQERSTRR